jgi:hypothetical protein
MTNPRTFLNRDVLKAETVAAIEAMGELASQIADRWAGGWPVRTRRLEQQGRLFDAIKGALEQEQKAKDYEGANPWVGGIESRQLFDLADEPPG